MKELLQSLWNAAKATNGPTRVVLAAALVIAMAFAGFSSFRAHNPSFVLLYSNLDESQLTAVQSAIAKGDIRFRVSSPPAPYSVWVESSKQYEALSQVATQSALQVDPRGIASNSGLESVWMSSGEREQMMLKRRWEEVELQLETYPWIGSAHLTSSVPTHGILSRASPDALKVSVVLELLGIQELSQERSETVVQIVSFAFGIPPENVAVSDQNGSRLNPTMDSRGLDQLLAHQEEYDRLSTDRVQQALDRAYGAGLTVASVRGEWSYDELESVEEKIDPSSKVPISEFSQDTQTPQSSPSSSIGHSGTDAATGEVAPSGESESLVATTSEVSKEYALSKNTSLLRKTTPVLKRQSISVVVDSSLKGDLTQIADTVKGFCAFNADRDTFSSMTASFPGVTRDEQGKPIPVTQEEPHTAMNPIVGTLLERAIEIIAACAFLFILFKSLKRSTTPLVRDAEKKTNISDLIPDDAVDIDALARAHVEELLKSDPERVSKLLSRWALGESYYSRSSS